MKERFDNQGWVQFVTFSCFKRRRLLNQDQCKRIVLGVLASEMAKRQVTCLGFVVMPDHVHALLKLNSGGHLPLFMKQWKQRSSVGIKRLFSNGLRAYADAITLSDPIWQAGYYAFAIHDPDKAKEKLTYLHHNPVRAGIAHSPAAWRYSSAPWYENGRSVGVPISWPG
ncbi:MAG: transposase [Desulfarculus sp.]|nr:transposase [Desulfarculus sp.]